MGMFPEPWRNNLKQLFFDFQRCFPRSQTCSVADSEDVRVDSDRVLVKKDIEQDVSRLSADAGKTFQFGSGSGYFTSEFFKQNSATFDQVPGLAVIQAERRDVFFQSILTEGQNSFRSVGYREKFCSSFIDTDICGLR